VLLTVVAGIAGPLLVIFAALYFMFLGASRPINTYQVGILKPALLVIFAMAFLMFAWGIGDLNVWSLHRFYRRRLMAAYAPRRVKVKNDRPPSANAVNGTDVVHLSGADKAPLAKFIGPAATNSDARQVDFPELLICAAANIADYGATPTGSHVTSFVFSQRELGGPLIGALPVTTYASKVSANDELTVPSAIAISGAAIAPSMGKMTRAPLRFLLALLNIRLGVWLPNPRSAAPQVERRSRGLGPSEIPKGDGSQSSAPDKEADSLRKAKPIRSQPRPIYLLYELLGWNRLGAKYLYLTDGGHYENLGLVELIRRRCEWIWCIDASGDAIDTFNTIGEALSLADGELGVHIEIFPERDMAPDPVVSAARADQGKPPLVRQPYCDGYVHYPNGTTGRLVIIKAGVWNGAPWEIQSFYERNRRFPCDPTTNQLYTGERFDAYRALGAAAMRAAWEEYGNEFNQFREERTPTPEEPVGSGVMAAAPAVAQSPSALDDAVGAGD
jgi:hypothetical protein